MFRFFLPLFLVCIFSCSDDGTDTPSILAPETYTFNRNGENTVRFSGQTTRILMATELSNALLDFSRSETDLLNMFSNQNSPFSNADLNASSKTVKSKTAASADYFASNAAASALIRSDFEGWISSQVDEVFPAQQQLASAGTAGQIADGSSTRYVNAKGLEYNQAFGKSLIGALMVDQILNNYLSPAVLDAGANRADNTAEVLEEGSSYTTMEHKWDEAYGYVYGTAADAANPNATIGSDDSFLNKYVGRVEGDTHFAGIAAEIFDAFKLGRAAIVGGDYELRDEQADIIREKVSEIIGIRAVYYLQQGKRSLEGDSPAYGTAFHDLSEGFGFVYSLQFTRKPGTDEPYFSRSEVQGFISQLEEGNGFWGVSPSTLNTISDQIASRFSFTVAQAAD